MSPRPLLFAAVLAAATLALPAFAERSPTGSRTSSSSTAKPSATPGKPTAIPPKPPTPAPARNPLLPAPIDLQNLYGDLSLIQKLPSIAPPGFEPLYTSEDWQAYRARFGLEADNVNRLKSSGVIDFANKLIAAANEPLPPTPASAAATASASQPTPPPPGHGKGFQRLCLLRAAALTYRNRDGYPTANKAVTAYLDLMDRHTPSHVGALWSISNQISRMAVTPKAERIRYDGIAARANMQLALLLVEADQVEAAVTLVRQLGYHEGWLRRDPAAAETRQHIAQVRARVNSAAKMMDWLGTQYEPALHNDIPALTAVYLYGRYVKNRKDLVADLPTRVPTSSLAQLANSIDASEKDPAAAFTAAENLRTVASALPEGTIRERTLFAALQLYRAFLATPQTERMRVQRTLARMSLEAVLADGARSGAPLDLFAPKTAPATQPALQPESEPTSRPADEIHPVG